MSTQSSDFLSYDSAIEQILVELVGLKNASDAISAAGENTTRVAQSAEAVTGAAARLIESTTQQAADVRRLADTTERQLALAITALTASSQAIDSLVRSDLLPAIERQRRLTVLNRALLILLLLCTAATLGLLLWLNRSALLA